MALKLCRHTKGRNRGGRVHKAWLFSRQSFGPVLSSTQVENTLLRSILWSVYIFAHFLQGLFSKKKIKEFFSWFCSRPVGRPTSTPLGEKRYKKDFLKMMENSVPTSHTTFTTINPKFQGIIFKLLFWTSLPTWDKQQLLLVKKLNTAVLLISCW